MTRVFRQLFDRDSSTYTYIVGTRDGGKAVIIDPVREHVSRDVGLLRELGLTLVYAIDTHVHADHVTGCGRLRAELGVKTIASERAAVDCADIIVGDGEIVRVEDHGATLELEARATPGHTNACTTYVAHRDGMAFTGDALLVRGCGRTDFQGGDAHALYHSITSRIFTLPDETLLYPAHDYQGRTVTSVREEKLFNPRVGGNRTEDEFVAIMSALALAPPAKMADSLAANRECGVPTTMTKQEA